MLRRAALVGLLLAGTGAAAEWREDFSRPPAERGWRVFGDASLFAWDEAREALRVTWDSSRPNSYFFRPLGTVLSRTDAFALGFDLELEEIHAGVNPEKPFTFELAVGFHRRADAEAPGFRRGTGNDAPNLVEFAWFPDSGWGATLWPTIISTNAQLNYLGRDDFLIQDLPPGHRFTVWMTFTNAVLTTTLWRDGEPVGAALTQPLTDNFTDFRVDAVAVRSYSDDGAGGSLRATGWVDNFRVQLPPPPVAELTGSFVDGAWQLRFQARAGWTYQVERAARVTGEWRPAGDPLPGVDGPLEWTDPAPPPGPAFYRVRADKP